MVNVVVGYFSKGLELTVDPREPQSTGDRRRSMSSIHVAFAASLLVLGACGSDQGDGSDDTTSRSTDVVPVADPSDSAREGPGDVSTSNPIALEPVELTAQLGSRSSNNFFAAGDYALDGYTAVDEAAFFASPDVFILADGLELPTDLVGFRMSQAELPEDSTIEAIAQATGIDLPVARYDDLPDQPDFDPPEGFAYWSVFDTSTGRGLDASRTGVGGVLPVQFNFSGPAVVVDGFYGEVGDTGPLCEFTDVPDPAGLRSDCDGDYAIEVETVTLPSVEAAEVFAASVVEATASGVDEFTFTTTVTEERPYPQVVVSVQPASPTVPLNWYFSFGADGRLAFAQGDVGTLDELNDVALIDLDSAIARLNDPAFRWLAPAGLDSADAPRPDEPSSRTIEIVAIEADLWIASSPVPYLSANYGLSYHLPAYAFIDTDGARHVVPAVTDDFLLEPADR